jgi:hypothetical protein
MDKVLVNDTVIYALARLVGDAQTERRAPSHSDIEFQIMKAGLEDSDPNREGSPVGKAKRVRAVLAWSLENCLESAEIFAAGLISSIKACGGFRKNSPNFVGTDSIKNLSDALITTWGFISRGWLIDSACIRESIWRKINRGIGDLYAESEERN